MTVLGAVLVMVAFGLPLAVVMSWMESEFRRRAREQQEFRERVARDYIARVEHERALREMEQ